MNAVETLPARAKSRPLSRTDREKTMSGTVGHFLVERLYQWGVRRIFGYPGDGINGMFGALC
ncbi:hypothetical protein C4Q28_12725 [Pseudomonas sp. SWI6]|nr:hypothetical protein C4Q28_12725 [Pseudomonas sp. SWI6]